MNLSELIHLYTSTPLAELMALADRRRREIKGDSKVVTFQIDRNVNITNICRSGCKFCSFHTRLLDKNRGYVTSLEQYCEKIEHMFTLGGNQLLLQGGMHPNLSIEYYEELFHELKLRYPKLKLHALGAPEVFYLAQKANITTLNALERLIDAGLDSLPGAGAEILDNQWRSKNSPAKCSADQWIDTMRDAHSLGLTTSATMMYGFNDSVELRMSHLIKIRELQAQTGGFSAFIAWPFCSKDNSHPSASEYLRMVAISRLALDNIENIQASWLTVGVEVGQVALFGGANDMGSIMIEENVVRSAGVSFEMNEERMRRTITEVGFIAKLRDQGYNILD